MARKPVTPALHGLVDYGFGIVNLAVPALLGLTGSARVVPAAWAVTKGTLNALTDQRYAVRRVVPFAMPGPLESAGLPTLAVTTVASGALKQPRARRFFAVLFADLVTNYKVIPEP